MDIGTGLTWSNCR